jgi:hypothetical protein
MSTTLKASSSIPIAIAGPILITKAQLSKAIATSPRTIDSWREKGIIPFIKVGGIVRFNLAKVMAALEARFEVHEISPGKVRSGGSA